MHIDTKFPPPASPRLAEFMRLVDAFEPAEIEAAVEALIEELDARAGDPDLEPNGDELDISSLDFLPRDPIYRLIEHKEAAFLTMSEDDEDDNPAEEDGEDACTAHDDDPLHYAADRHAGDPDDAEEDSVDRCEAGDDGCGVIVAGLCQMFWGSSHQDSDQEKPWEVTDRREGSGACRPLFR